MPLYYCNRSNFKWREKTGADYEAWLKCFTTDKSEKHSGAKSLKVTVNSLTQEFWFYSWRTATRKGASGVFTVWMKGSNTAPRRRRIVPENRTVEIKDGKLVDTYAPFARHIYRYADLRY